MRISRKINIILLSKLILKKIITYLMANTLSTTFKQQTCSLKIIRLWSDINDHILQGIIEPGVPRIKEEKRWEVEADGTGPEITRGKGQGERRKQGEGAVSLPRFPFQEGAGGMRNKVGKSLWRAELGKRTPNPQITLCAVLAPHIHGPSITTHRKTSTTARILVPYGRHKRE